MLPGLLCDEAVWHHQQQYLRDLADVVIPIFRGFDSLHAMAESVLQIAPQNFCVAGHSMGGRVALEIVHLVGDRVTKLALLDTAIHPRAEGEAEKRQVLLDMATEHDMLAVANAWIPPMVHPGRRNDPVLIPAIRAMVLRYSVQDFQGQVKALLERPDATPYLRDIHCETLVACGRQDGWAPVAQHEEIAASLAVSELKIIEDSGHMAPMEQAAEVTTLLRNWLTDRQVPVRGRDAVIRPD